MVNSNLEEISRQPIFTVTAFCRSCKQTEVFDCYKITLRHYVTGEIEEAAVRVCQGCKWEKV